MQRRSYLRSLHVGTTRRQWLVDSGKWMITPALLARSLPTQAIQAPAMPSADWREASLFGLQNDPLSERSVWISDLKRCQPESALSRGPATGRWQVVEYEARYGEKDLKGSMLLAGPETSPPAIRLGLEQRGWHAIFVGMKSFLGYGD